MNTEQFKLISAQIDTLEVSVKEAVSVERSWTRREELLTDRLATLAAYVYDTSHNRDCSPNEHCTKYKYSILRKFRRALGHEL